LETDFRCKGIHYDFVEIDLADFRACARATGISTDAARQRPDGSWLTNTKAIIAHSEATLAVLRGNPLKP